MQPFGETGQDKSAIKHLPYIRQTTQESRIQLRVDDEKKKKGGQAYISTKNYE